MTSSAQTEESSRLASLRQTRSDDCATGDRQQIIVRYRLALWASAICVGLLQALAYRHNVTPDGISYLDIAREVSQGSWHALINAYWSPLYPLLLGIIFRVLRPSPSWEFTLAHLVNFGVFLCSFLAFEFLLRMWIRSEQTNHAGSKGTALTAPEIWLLGSSLFIWFTVLFIRLENLVPDLCVAALLYVAVGLVLRMRACQSAVGTYVALGVVLGISYLAKAVMFPLAFVVLGCGLFSRKPFSKAAALTLVALMAFLATGSPFIYALSKSKNRVTVGEVGKIAYAEFVDGAPRYVHWHGEPGWLGEPVHPTRHILSDPAVYEFSTPIEGSYPPWYDPSYWYDGIKPQFRVGRQLSAIRYTIEEYAAIASYMAGLLVGFIGITLLVKSRGFRWSGLFSGWIFLVPAVAGLGLYAVVYVESRFVAAFFVLAWLGLFTSLRSDGDASVRLYVRCLIAAIVVMLGAGIVWVAGRSFYRAIHPEPFRDLQVAEFLQADGVQPTERIASIGDSLNGAWAHLAGVKIVAEVPLEEIGSFLSADSTRQQKMLSVFSQIGAREIVIDRKPPENPQIHWERIGSTNYYVCDSVSRRPTSR